MRDGLIDVARLQALSRLFRYPEQWPGARHLDSILPEDKRQGDFYAQKDLKALQAGYISLFVNALPEIPCPPYGSFYLEGTLMGVSTVRLNQLYNEYGFQTDELADHIAVELEFLAFLTTLSSYDPVMEDYEFLLNHLRQWTPAFFEQVEKHDKDGFYRDVCQSSAGILLA